MHRGCGQEAVAEVFQVKMDPADLGTFLKKGEKIHHFLSSLEGYSGLEIFLLAGNKLIVQLRWKNYRLFDQQLASILNACPLTDWFRGALQLSQQPAMIRSFFPE